ncbi:glycine/betaine ABC transporter substrate-binding protein [Thalassospira lucentensis]|jgi:glycine betaine/proline transport system substrate-binding protein|uniref:Glycine/betaine ABC transporter substrate-binding protein n=2 Tax=Thalassospira TaxID=168934 RepID=A0A367X6W9_9PROT|nr:MULTISPECIES: glycine betaine/L-proline ABC transporter substrate-binding protein ProX [Thalassospira]KZB54403.1 glycine/betaine ABC transporter substrate-binding protein [Thalassospira xiamenensis]KZB68251.1 glycine/betaine ABC transporter substrate-binding protein [Thalassospira lucentensis]MBO9509016.1 glycine betaine/L-proline ABC transporter substrate-binding protein ProX [Thalassospira sp. A3_1]MCK2165636.1 glycine betaine/L-proline ABC transporter substrate-binding protein ProX [Thala
MTILKKLSTGAAIAVTSSFLISGAAFADDMKPGEGVEVQPLKSSIAEETFQTVLVMKALEELGYDVKDIQEIEYAAGHVAIGNGDATFLADHWNPLHADFYKAAGGDEKIYREGVYSPGALQGYLIDKKTADEHNITNISQLSDPEIAKIFDNNGDGKADLAGCNPGWGCEGVIEHHLDAYDLRDTVAHNQGSYSAIIADTITRYKAGEPILYYTWTPYWVSGVLVPGKDVTWLQVPFSSLPGENKDADTALPDGSNYGFQVNNQQIIANKAWAEENPAAAKLFAIMELSANDISAQNLRMRDGEKSAEDINRHADAWIKANQAKFDGWLEEARKAAM